MHTLRRRLMLAAGLMGVVFAIAPRAQDAAGQSEQAPVFRGGVDSVVVDAIVTDDKGAPVTDLTAADFEIRESGDVQTIESFRLVQTDDGLDDSSAREILSFDDQRRETAREDNRLFVLFMDDYHVRLGNSMTVREQVARFVTNLTPHDLVAVVTPTSIVSGLTFSRNHVATANVVREFKGRKYDYTPMNAIEARYQQMGPEAQERFRNDLVISAMRNLCIQLGALRDGRKTILYVSEGMSGYVPSGVRTRGGFYGPTTVDRGNDPRLGSQDFFENSSLLSRMDEIFSAASRNNVSIYTLDPRGLSNFEYGVDEDVNSAADRQILNESVDMLRVVAEQTDGRAIVARNDPIPALRQMVRDSSTYYLLGYTSTRAPRDGKFHEIEVKVKRRGVQVRARRGYWAYSAEDVARVSAPTRPAAPEAVSDALGTLGTSASAARGRAVTLWAGSLRGPNEKALVTLAWEPVTPNGGSASDPAETVDRVAVTAESSSGEQVFSGTIARDASGSTGGHVTFEAPPGDIQVHVSVENGNGRRIDSDETDVTVPDFTTAGPTISTPFVYRGRTVRDLQQIRAAAEPTPTVRRSFLRTERLLIRFGAYGPAGTTPTLSVVLLNQLGETLATLPAPQPAGSLFESELPLSSFPPGDYVVKITAESGGQTAEQFLAIRVSG